jgi:SagB-type dehydrogenase family enzyme
MANRQISIATHYHERTKYHPETIAAKSKGLDWANQPSPFKEYRIGKSFDLKPFLNESKIAIATPESEWQRLSRLLFCSYGLTAKLPTMGAPIYLRAAPSAGGLYPAEVYLISRGTSLLGAGLYSYQPQNHSLVHFWENDVWSNLQAACFAHRALETTSLALVTTAIFYRSAWRYEDRAYRRIFLDTGHLLGNITLASAMNDYRPYLIGGFQDRAMTELLYLDSQQEGVITVIPIADLQQTQQPFPNGKTALPSGINIKYEEMSDGKLLSYFHESTEIARPNADSNFEKSQSKNALEDKYNFPFCLKIATKTSPIDWRERLSGLEGTMLRRRSTRAYSGKAIAQEELNALLDFTYHPEHYLEQGLDPSPDYFDLDLIETFVAVSAVSGLEEGCYYYAPKVQELRQIRFKNFRRELHFLCLGQELGRDAAAVVFHTADLQKAIAKYGDRVYRYLHMDAGHLGQRLNLAAIHLRLGASGIGGFFDDQVNEVLGIPEDEAVIYITTLGQPGE